jgi:hypothetical protein
MTDLTKPASVDFNPALVAYVAALSGMVATLCGLSGLAIYLWLNTNNLSVPLSLLGLLVPISFAAVVVMTIAGFIIHAMVRLRNRFLYMLGTLVVIGACFPYGLSEAVRDPMRSGGFLIPIAALPAGVFLYHVLSRPDAVPAFERRDAFIVGSWAASCVLAYFFYAVGFHSSSGPRGDIIRLVAGEGVSLFLLCGVAAGFLRLRWLQLGRRVAIASWLIPLACLVAFVWSVTGS